MAKVNSDTFGEVDVLTLFELARPGRMPPGRIFLHPPSELRVPQTLTIGDLTIHPYAYRETKHYTGQGASIRLRVKLSPDATQHMRGMVHRGEFVPVTVHSRGPDPLEMFLATPEWSREGEGTKYDLVLYDRAWMAHRPRKLRNEAGAAAFTDAVLRRLLERLVAKGVLTANERKGMESSAEDLVGLYLVEISEVDDIDVEPFDSAS